MSAFDDLYVDHVSFAVADLTAVSRQWLDNYGMSTYARRTDSRGPRTIAVGSGDIQLLFTEAGDADHPAAAYVQRHGDGVFDIAMTTPDVRSAYRAAVGAGGRPISAPEEHDGVLTATVGGSGDVSHTFVERAPGVDRRVLPGLLPVEIVAPAVGGLHTADHFAVCVESGQLQPTVDFYQAVFGFVMVFTERIVIGRQAMDSMVVQSRSGAVTLTILEPDVAAEPGQIDQFIKDHGGAGVQHVAFATDGIVADVDRLSGSGVEFLPTPGTYYEQLADRLTLRRYSVDQLRELNILVDQDQDGQLLQIFTRTTHPRGTLFFELIERQGARTFGSGNIKALYTAVEAQREREPG
jgi:4-hydroxymandelate synthase